MTLTPRSSDSSEHFDVLVVGAGISGIGAAWHLRRHCPSKSFAVLGPQDSFSGTAHTSLPRHPDGAVSLDIKGWRHMVTDRDDWVARFSLRLAMLDGQQHPLEQLIALGEELWSRFSGVEPEVVAEAEFRAGSRA